MNPKNFFPKISSVAVSMLLAIGSSLIALQPANAVVTVTSVPTISGSPEVGATLTATVATWSDTSTGNGKWYVCSASGSATTSVPASCYVMYTGSSGTTPVTSSTLTIPNINYCNSFCTNFGNSSVGYYYRYIETSADSSAISASATIGPIVEVASGSINATSGSSTVSAQFSCTLSSSQTISGFSFTVNSTARSITNTSYTGNTITFTLASNVSSGDSVVLSYARSGAALTCTNGNAIPASMTLSRTVSGGGGGGGVNTCIINGVTQTALTSVTSTVSTLTPSNSYRFYFNGDSTLVNCMFPVGPGFGTLALLNGSLIGTPSFTATTGLGYGPINTTRTLAQLLATSNFSGRTVADGDIYTIRYFPNTSQAPTINSTGYVEASITLMPGVSGQQVTATVERSIPTSVFQAPILNSLAPKMTGGFSSTGGRLVMKDVKPADISSVMLNGKKVEVIASKSGSALRIPAGAGAGDLTFTMADGTVLTVANAVKITPSQVDPKLVDLNPLPTFKAGSVAVPAAIKSALNKRKAIILDSASAKCVGYASSNTAAARATALSRASNVCGVITDINENIEPIVKVLVNKTVAKKSPVKYQTW